MYEEIKEEDYSETLEIMGNKLKVSVTKDGIRVADKHDLENFLWFVLEEVMEILNIDQVLGGMSMKFWEAMKAPEEGKKVVK